MYIEPNITYTNHIHAMDIIPFVNDLENVVIRVKWEIIARSGTHISSSYMVTQLKNVQDQENFVSFENLTESMVLDWVFDVEPIEKIKDQLAAEIKEKIDDPVVEFVPPWKESSDWSEQLFVLVHNDKVVWGLSKLNIDMINAVLKVNGVEATLDKDWLNTPPSPAVQIAENTWLYTVVEQRDEIENSLFYEYGPIQWEFSKSHGAVATHTIVQRPLDVAQKIMINKAIQNTIYSPVISVNIADTEIKILQSHFPVYFYTALINDDDTQLQITDIKGNVHNVKQSEFKKALSHFVMDTLSVSGSETGTASLIKQIKNAESVEELMQIQIEKK